ncbi:MAG: hypothetical protein POH28_08495 [Acidocella sp.]|nr:hypothetical protein [Acidocella sp.]
MSHRNHLRARLLSGATLSLALAASLFSGGVARASDPLPGDAIAPPVNINIALYYNQIETAGEIGAVHGSSDSHNTRIAADIQVARFVHTFNLGGTEAGFQAFVPYVSFLGQQSAGVANIPAPATGLPPFGPGHASLSTADGFGQPNFGAFLFPVNNAATGTYAVIGPWISPPVSGYNKSANLNPGNNVWTYEMEAGFRKILFGTPTTHNLAIEVWGEAYLFGANNNAAANSPEVFANNIPPIYSLFGVHNPLAAASSTPARFNEQPSEEFRVYLPYQIYPATGGTITPGFYQSFGGKQTYTLRNGAKIDSGNRTDESQFRLTASTFLSPTWAVMLVGEYDIANHGGPLQRNVELRLATFF